MLTHRCPTIEEFKDILKKHSLKATPQRLASVYNILSQLALLGIYHHRMSCNNKMYFDVNTFYHCHLYDQENHTFKDVLDDDLIALIQSHLGRKRFKGYKVEGIDIQIIGRPTKRKYFI